MKPTLETESCLFNRGESLSLASAWCFVTVYEATLSLNVGHLCTVPSTSSQAEQMGFQTHKKPFKLIAWHKQVQPSWLLPRGFCSLPTDHNEVLDGSLYNGGATMFYCPQFFFRCFNIFCSCMLHRQPAKQRLSSRGDFSKCISLLYWNKKGNQNSNSSGSTSAELVIKWEA